MTALAIASFTHEAAFVAARGRAADAHRRIVGEWMPYAVEALESADGTRGILAAAIVAGLAGAIGLFALTTWSAVLAYRFDAGGRPLFSWAAFIPAPVEFGALTAAIGGIILFFLRAGLTRLHHPAFDIDEVMQVSQGTFVLAIACDAGEDANATLALLAEVGAAHSRVITP